MIIQAGFDLEFLARLLIAPTGQVLPMLVVIELDADMQLADLRLVTNQFDGSLGPHVKAILDPLETDTTRYFAIAHAGCWPECTEVHAPILEEAEALREAAIERGFLMIGHFGLDGVGYMSNGPHYYFDRYPLGLPCTMDHWIHSKHGKCG